MRRVLLILTALILGCQVAEDECEELCRNAITKDICKAECIIKQSDPTPKQTTDGGAS